MRNITRLMIDEYNLKDIDFMGYKFRKSEASFHHLIVPARNNGKETIENGAVLNANTSHPYLHLIECFDYDKFLAITNEMIEENMLGRIDSNCLKRIDEILREFEKENKNRRTSKGKMLIKEEFTRRIRQI